MINWLQCLLAWNCLLSESLSKAAAICIIEFQDVQLDVFCLSGQHHLLSGDLSTNYHFKWQVRNTGVFKFSALQFQIPVGLWNWHQPEVRPETLDHEWHSSSERRLTNFLTKSSEPHRSLNLQKSKAEDAHVSDPSPTYDDNAMSIMCMKLSHMGINGTDVEDAAQFFDRQKTLQRPVDLRNHRQEITRDAFRATWPSGDAPSETVRQRRFRDLWISETTVRRRSPNSETDRQETLQLRNWPSGDAPQLRNWPSGDAPQLRNGPSGDRQETLPSSETDRQETLPSSQIDRQETLQSSKIDRQETLQLPNWPSGDAPGPKLTVRRRSSSKIDRQETLRLTNLSKFSYCLSTFYQLLSTFYQLLSTVYQLFINVYQLFYQLYQLLSTFYQLLNCFFAFKTLAFILTWGQG